MTVAAGMKLRALRSSDERLLCADIVEKVENRTTAKIPQKLIFWHAYRCKARGADTKVLGRFCVKR
jgi:hypothetical protein